MVLFSRVSFFFLRKKVFNCVFWPYFNVILHLFWNRVPKCVVNDVKCETNCISLFECRNDVLKLKTQWPTTLRLMNKAANLNFLHLSDFPDKITLRRNKMKF